MTAPAFGTFRSHSSADKPDVEALARRLTAAGLRPWLDKWPLIAGDPWQEEIERALQACTPGSATDQAPCCCR